MRKLTLCVLTVFFLTATTVLALEKSDEEALKNTQKLLSDQKAMNEFAKGNKDAVHALDQVKELTHGNQQQQAEINNISSSIFTDMVKQSNGDSAAIQEKLQQALKDPKAFMKSLTPEQRAQIQNLAGKMDKQNGGTASVDPKMMQQAQEMVNNLTKQGSPNRSPGSVETK